MTYKDSFSKPLAVLEQREMFQRRHIGPSSFEQVKMLESLGIDSLLNPNQLDRNRHSLPNEK